MKLKDLLNKRVVLNYQSKVGTNDQQGLITHIGADRVGFNIGRKELFIEKSKINYATDMHSNLLFKR